MRAITVSLTVCGVVAVIGCDDGETCPSTGCPSGGAAQGGGAVDGGASAGGQGGAAVGGGGEGGEASCIPAPEDCATPEDEDCDGASPPCSGVVTSVTELGTNGEWSALATTPGGSAVAAGFVTSLALNGEVLSGSVALRLDPAGALAWGVSLPSTHINSVAVLADGRIVLGGDAQGEINLPALGVFGSGGFVVVLNDDGSLDEGRSFYDSGVRVDVVEAAADGGYYIAGRVPGGRSIDFGLGSYVANGDKTFVAKMDADNVVVWGRLFGENGQFAPMDATEDDAGRPVIVGSLEYGSGGVDLGGGYLFGGGAALRLRDGGAYEESRAFVSTPFGVDVRPSGFAVLTSGETESGPIFHRLDPDLSTTGAAAFGGHDPTRHGQPFSADDFGNLLYAGGPADFGQGPVSGPALSAVKLRPDGSVVWARQFATGVGSPSVIDGAPGMILLAGYAAAGTVLDDHTIATTGLFIAYMQP